MPSELAAAPLWRRSAGYEIGSPAPHSARSAICRKALDQHKPQLAAGQGRKRSLRWLLAPLLIFCFVFPHTSEASSDPDKPHIGLTARRPKGRTLRRVLGYGTLALAVSLAGAGKLGVFDDKFDQVVSSQLTRAAGRPVAFREARLKRFDELHLGGIVSQGPNGGPRFEANGAVIRLNLPALFAQLAREMAGGSADLHSAPVWESALATGARWVAQEGDGLSSAFSFGEMRRSPSGRGEDRGTFSAGKHRLDFTVTRPDNQRAQLKLGSTSCQALELPRRGSKPVTLEATCHPGGDRNLTALLADLGLSTVLGQLPDAVGQTLAGVRIERVKLRAERPDNAQPIYTQELERFDLSLAGSDGQHPVTAELQANKGQEPQLTVKRGSSSVSWTGRTGGRIVAELDAGELGLGKGKASLTGNIDVGGDGGALTLRDALLSWPGAHLSVERLSVAGFDQAIEAVLAGRPPTEHLVATLDGASGRASNLMVRLDKATLSGAQLEGTGAVGTATWEAPASLRLGPDGRLHAEIGLADDLSASCVAEQATHTPALGWRWSSRCELPRDTSALALLTAFGYEPPDRDRTAAVRGKTAVQGLWSRGGDLLGAQLIFDGHDGERPLSLDIRTAPDALGPALFLDNRVEGIVMSHGDKGQLVFNRGRVDFSTWLPDLVPGLPRLLLEGTAALPLGDWPVFTGVELKLGDGHRVTARKLRLGARKQTWADVLHQIVSGDIPRWELMNVGVGGDVPLDLTRVAPGQDGTVTTRGRIGLHSIEGELSLGGSRRPVVRAKGRLAGAPFDATARWNEGRLPMSAVLDVVGQRVEVETPNLLDRRGVFALRALIDDLTAFGLFDPHGPDIGLPAQLGGTIDARKGELRLRVKIPSVEFAPPWADSPAAKRGADDPRKPSGGKVDGERGLDRMLSLLEIGVEARAPIYVGSAHAGRAWLKYDARHEPRISLSVAGPVTGELGLERRANGDINVLGGNLSGALSWPLKELPLSFEGPLAQLAHGTVTVRFDADVRGATADERRDLLRASGSLLLGADSPDSPRIEVDFSKQSAEPLLLQQIRVRLPGKGCLVGSGEVDLVQETISAKLALAEADGLRWLAKGREFTLSGPLRDATLDHEHFLALIPRALGNILGIIPSLFANQASDCPPLGDSAAKATARGYGDQEGVSAAPR